jgi:hypothetical protein
MVKNAPQMDQTVSDENFLCHFSLGVFLEYRADSVLEDRDLVKAGKQVYT